MFELNTHILKSQSNAQLKAWIDACEKEQITHLSAVANNILAGNFTLVALAGPSCSGKTTTAHRLISLLSKAGKDVMVISTDDYFHNTADFPLTHDGAPDFDHFDCVKKSLLSEVLRGICMGEEVSLSRFDFVTGRRTDNVASYKPKENSIVILEGIHALNPLLYRDGVRYYKLGLNVTRKLALDGEELLTPREIRLVRRIIRDEKKRNYRAEQTMNIWENVARGEENFIFPFFRETNALLTTGLAYEACVWRNDALDSLLAVPRDDPHRPLADAMIKKVQKFPSLSTEFVPQDSILQEFLGHNEH